MSLDIQKLLNAVSAAASAYQAALDIAEDAVAVISPASQADLKDRLAHIRAENDAGHARLQAKLDVIIGDAQ